MFCTFNSSRNAKMIPVCFVNTLNILTYDEYERIFLLYYVCLFIHVLIKIIQFQCDYFFPFNKIITSYGSVFGQIKKLQNTTSPRSMDKVNFNSFNGSFLFLKYYPCWLLVLCLIYISKGIAPLDGDLVRFWAIPRLLFAFFLCLSVIVAVYFLFFFLKPERINK